MPKLIRQILGLPARFVNWMADALYTETVVGDRRVLYTRVINPEHGDLIGGGPVGSHFVVTDLGPTDQSNNE